jgi:hypothetical protein
MSDILSELASKSGVSLDQAKHALAGLMAFLKDKLPADLFAKITHAIPGADSMATEAKTEEAHAHTGMLSSITSALGKLFGGGSGVAALASQLTKLGLSADQVKSFFHHALELLKSKLPPDVMSKVSALMPSEAAEAK